MSASSPIDHRSHSPAEAGSSSIHRSQAEARSHIPASLIDRAFVVPFLPFSIVPLGLVARGDGHTIGERKPRCPTPGASKTTREMTGLT